MIVNAELKAILEKFTKYVVSQSRANLTRKDKNVKGKLYQSLKGGSFVGKNSLGVYFEMEDYGVYQDQGVQGASGQNKGREQIKQGGFRFGTGTGKKGGMRKGILEWVKAKGIQFRSENGRFLTSEATANIISRSVYQKGIKASRFFSKPFEDGLKRLPDEVLEAYGLDVEKTIKTSLDKWN
jgi:hypothetical protein